jgi:hypothetical protein
MTRQPTTPGTTQGTTQGVTTLAEAEAATPPPPPLVPWGAAVVSAGCLLPAAEAVVAKAAGPATARRRPAPRAERRTAVRQGSAPTAAGPAAAPRRPWSEAPASQARARQAPASTALALRCGRVAVAPGRWSGRCPSAPPSPVRSSGPRRARRAPAAPPDRPGAKMPPAGLHARRPTRPRPSAGSLPTRCSCASVGAHVPIGRSSQATSAVWHRDCEVRCQWQASDSEHELVVLSGGWVVSGAGWFHWHEEGMAGPRCARHAAAHRKGGPRFTAPARHAAWPRLPAPRGW